LGVDIVVKKKIRGIPDVYLGVNIRKLSIGSENSRDIFILNVVLVARFQNLFSKKRDSVNGPLEYMYA